MAMQSRQEFLNPKKWQVWKAAYWDLIKGLQGSGNFETISCVDFSVVEISSPVAVGIASSIFIALLEIAPPSWGFSAKQSSV